MSLRIGIDARFLNHPRLGGYQTYLQELVTAFHRRPPAHEIFLLLASADSSFGDAFHRVVQPVRLPFAGVAWREQVAIPRVSRRLSLDLMHFPCNTMPVNPGVPSVATIHDTIGLDNRQPTRGMRQTLIRRYERFAVRNSLRRARLVITPSENVAADLAVAGVPATRLRTVHSGIRGAMRPAGLDALRRFRLEHDLKRPFLLALASSDPRKNVETAIAALGRSRQGTTGLGLVVLMASPNLQSSLKAAARHHGVEERVRFLAPLSAADLALLYASARTLLFLSLDEGFGMPPLESMACGTPVICSDRPPMSQLYGDAVLKVQPTDVAGVAAAIDRLDEDAGLRAALVSRGQATAARFSWDRAAEQTVAIYEEAIAC